MNKSKSLRTQLLSKLSLPLLVVVMLDAAGSYYVATYFTNQAYDRWLLDSAKSLLQEVKIKQDRVTFELPPIAAEVFRWDDMDETFYKVESQQTGFMAGDDGLPSPAMSGLNENKPYFFDGRIDDRPVRVASVLTVPESGGDRVLVSVAETVNKRRGMTGELLLAVMLPQILLVLITGFHIWTGVNRGLSPLNDLAGMIARRSARDFDPIPDADVPLEVRSLTHTINALLQRLGSTLITQRRFIENAAHQLRTPLAGLKIQAERALSADSPDSMRQALEHIKNASNRLARLNTQLLVLARSDSISRNAPEFRLLDLTRLARECCMDWVPRALELKVELSFDAPATAVEIYGDGIVLRELLGNLLDNAVNYGKAGGHIGVTVESAPHVRLIVEDDGPGIPVGEQEKIFERFYRIPGSPGEGCGLGLAIVKEIADLHAARIEIHSGLPAQIGTRVEICFAEP
ncbi:sensor histidine kinase N-terminal domain-containing protein [Methylomonas sp. SURF-2]|uniref:histidine kinase n=1 Tax=Methylomonas subterranea TaxID=2952225 RepID=A0ABT1TI33_9GAMM|nr:sensor histidine kinase [Methylomonas sp. SURF-2]MCQ8105118.1 sensor histidine kinase N-terminal domain-containing protein [Methylomonas sp. SURF-2]